MRIRAVRVREGERTSDEDSVAIEAPLAIEIDGTIVATTMRTPGDDRSLAIGLLVSEGLIAEPSDLEEVVIERAECDVARIRRSAHAAARAIPVRVGTMTSACGLCGRLGIEEILAMPRRAIPARSVSVSAVRDALTRLESLQTCFAATGGVHAAAIFSEAGVCLASAEDVGRHNAVDKAVGASFERGGLDEAALLVVSGRTSFEIVHKAIAAGVSVVASVSAPSSLAVELAERSGLVLAGFVRGQSMNVYANPHRLDA